MRTITNKRIAELSATLKPIPTRATDEIAEEACEFISYNHWYFCDGQWIVTDYNSCIDSLHLQAVGEYQVMRFYHEDYFMDGGTFCRYGDSEDGTDENGQDLDFPELESMTFEVRQIWIDREGNTTDVILDEAYDLDVVNSISIDGLQEWAYEPKVKNEILHNTAEELYYDQMPIGYYLSTEREYLSKAEPRLLGRLEEDYNNTETILHFFPTLRIAHRHHYDFPLDKIGLYIDYLRMLEQVGMDLNNPRYICPKDIEAEHQRLCDIKTKKQWEIRKAEARRYEPTFAQMHKDYMGIVFDTEEFHFQSLDSAEAYVEESRIMHHCIGVCKYYEHEDELSFHITDHEGNRVATTTINLRTRKVVELQTLCNNPEWRKGNEYKTIWNTLCARMHTFPHKRAEEKKQQLKIAI